MRNRIPGILPWVVVGDNARLVAEMSSILGRRHNYLAVLDGPRLARPDADAEVLRRNNAAARVRPRRIFFAGLPLSTCEQFAPYWPVRRTQRVDTAVELLKAHGEHLASTPLAWGHRNPGIGLLTALRARRRLEFDVNAGSPAAAVGTRSGHLVVCEEGDDLSQIIAANYAFALDAGLCLIPGIGNSEADDLLERLYSLYATRGRSPRDALLDIKRELRTLAGPLPLAPGGSLTFVCRRIPWGFGFTEQPATHLFSHPDLGIAIVNGLTEEQPDTTGVTIASFVDPGSVDSKEIATAVDRVVNHGAFAMGVRSRNATVHRVAHLVESFPYDLLLISTHCGDAPGWRWTYEFVDSEGLPRTLVTDIAIGAEYVPGESDVQVTQFHRFVSLDGVDWADPLKKEKLYVGRAILDWSDRAEAGEPLEPTTKERVSRVPGSMALRMFDDNYIALSRAIAGNGSPIVINNACASWHRLAGTFMFGNARAYVGTLFDVLDVEAQAIVATLFGRYWGKPLAWALWRAQNDSAGDDARRPYVMVGCHFQRLRSSARGSLKEVRSRLQAAIDHWQSRLDEGPTLDPQFRRRLEGTLLYLRSELEAIDRWRSGS